MSAYCHLLKKLVSIPKLAYDFFVGYFGDDAFQRLYLGLNTGISVIRASIL